MKIEREKAEFRPIVITVETEAELHQLIIGTQAQFNGHVRTEAITRLHRALSNSQK